MVASHEELRSLQEALLKAVLLGHRLPGGLARVSLPDLEFVTAGDTIQLMDENLYGPLMIEGAKKPFRVVGRGELQATSGDKPALAFLKFQSTEINQDSVKMALEARTLPAAAGPEMGLSSIRIEFKKIGDAWIAQAPILGAM